MEIVCPVCHGTLVIDDDRILCSACNARFGYVNGIPDLIVGQRFDDVEDDTRCACEEASTAYTVANYWVPQLRRLTAGIPGRPRILAVGCGAGVEVDLLNRNGFECVGIDCGQRTQVWPRRESRKALYLANGMKLPFRDAAFDVAFCGCVFPHVGVEGDSFKVTAQYDADRQQLAREMARVVKPGGHILVTSPNRYFPFDLFHGRESGNYRIRPYWPGDRFLLSVADYARLFSNAGCRDIRTLPIGGYWGFLQSKKNVKGYILGLPVRALFWLVDRTWLPFVRSSPLAPWIAVLATR